MQSNPNEVSVSSPSRDGATTSVGTACTPAHPLAPAPAPAPALQPTAPSTSAQMKNQGVSQLESAREPMHSTTIPPLSSLSLPPPPELKGTVDAEANSDMRNRQREGEHDRKRKLDTASGDISWALRTSRKDSKSSENDSGASASLGAGSSSRGVREIVEMSGQVPVGRPCVSRSGDLSEPTATKAGNTFQKQQRSSQTSGGIERSPQCGRRSIDGKAKDGRTTSGAGTQKADAAATTQAAPGMAQAQKKTRQRTYADAALAAAVASAEELPDSLRRKRRRRVNTSPELRSVLRKLLSRELGSEDALGTRRASARERFANVSLQATFDTHDPDALLSKMAWLQRRSKIIEIVSSRDLIFSLTHTGVCAAFSRDLGRRVCFLNLKSDEVIRSLFLNKTNDALITVSVFKADDFSSLHCRSTPLAHIRKGYLGSAHAIFESESLRWPGFVEFDDVNSRVLTFSAEDRTYKVWDLETYRHLYTFRDDRIAEIKISPGIMLLIYARQESYVPLKIVDVSNGKVLKEMRHLLHRKRKVDFIEQFNEKLLVKQENENLQIVDVRTGSRVIVERSNFLTPNAFIFLYENRVFLTFRHRHISVWNFAGELQTKFEDHVLWHADSNTSSIYITQAQDLIMSYCQQEAECSHGSINISWIADGKSLCKISCGPNHGDEHVRALEDVTALYYNEERNEIYTGNRHGHIHVWSS